MPVIKAHGGMEIELHSFITLALDRNDWPMSQIGHFTLDDETPGTD